MLVMAVFSVPLRSLMASPTVSSLFMTESAPSCNYDFSERMSRDVKLCFIGVIKEALSNTAKHSDGDSIKIIIREHPALYQLSIADNGSCPEKIDESGMGLANMRERAASLNGNINITSGSKGFRIFLSVPKQNLTERRS